MKKRDYPLILIDRSKAASYPNDYVACFDRQVGFIAKVLFFPENDIFNEFVAQLSEIDDSELAGLPFRLKKGGVALQVVDFLYYFDVTTETKNRVQVLLKKALKKYLHTEVERTPHKSLGIDDQIRQQQLTLERAIQNYDDLVARANGDRSIADYTIDLGRETLRTLERFKEMKAFLDSGIKIKFDPNEPEN